MKKRRNSIIASIIAGIVLIIISVYTLAGGRSFSTPETILKDSIQMIEYFIFKKPIGFIQDVFNKYDALSRVYEENDILKSQLNRYAQLLAENNQLKADMEKMKAIVDIEFLPSDYKSQVAVVLGRDIEVWGSKITISLGNSHGVEEGMVVVSTKGIVGRVSSVGEVSSTVTLLIAENPADKLPIMVLKPNGEYAYGLLNGYNLDKQAYEIRLFSSAEGVQIGAEVSTSGEGGKSPRGILVGKVLQIENRPDSIAPYIYVTPEVDFDQLEYIAVVRREDNQ